MTRCPQSEQLQDHLEGLLPTEGRLRIEAHLLVCASCAAELALLRRVFGSLDALPLLAPTPGFADRVLARTHPEPSPVWTRAFGIAFGTGLAVSAATLAAAILLPGPRTWLRALAGDAVAAVGEVFVFVMQSLNSGLLRTIDLFAAAGSLVAGVVPLVRALLAPLQSPVIVSVSVAAIVACALVLWWMRPRESGKGVTRV